MNRLRRRIVNNVWLWWYWNGLNKDQLRVWRLRNLKLQIVWNLEYGVFYQFLRLEYLSGAYICVGSLLVWLEFKRYWECRDFRFVKEVMLAGPHDWSWRENGLMVWMMFLWSHVWLLKCWNLNCCRWELRKPIPLSHERSKA